MIIRSFDPVSDMVCVIELYQTCFAEPPWNERFEISELEMEFSEIVSWEKSLFLVACEEGSDQKIVGAAIAFSLSRKPDVLDLISEEERESLYMAELFVARDKRQHGIGKMLTDARMRLGWDLGFRRAVVRTSLEQRVIQDLYQKIYGFQIVSLQEIVSSNWIGNIEHQVHTRVILSGNIPSF